MYIQSLILKIEFRGKVCDLESPTCLPQIIKTDRKVYRPKTIVSWMNNSLAMYTVNDETWKCRDIGYTHSLKSLYYMFARLYNVHTPNMWIDAIRFKNLMCNTAVQRIKDPTL
jgi:hypothetical protein